MKSSYRLAPYVLVAWTILAAGLVAAAAIASGQPDPPGVSADNVRVFAVIGAGFLLWMTGLVTITCVTVILRVSHLAPIFNDASLEREQR
jgi:hypothetical protein